MYDTAFICNTYDLKCDILNGRYFKGSIRSIQDLFQSNISKTPFIFNVETTNYCNMKCVMCQRTTDLNRPLQHMSMQTFDSLVEAMIPIEKDRFNDWQIFVNNHLRERSEASENNFYYDFVFNSVTLHGFEEPLLDPLLPERVARLTEKNIPSYFSANPCNIRLDFIKELFKAGLSYIKFAVDSLDDDRANEIRGKHADFNMSYQKILAVLDLKKEMNADTTIVLTMLDFSGYYGPEAETSCFLRLWEGKDVYAYVKTLDNKWLLDKKGEVEKRQGKNKSHYVRQYCEFPWTSVTILVDGSVVPCTQDINGTWVFGNINKEPLESIWNNPKFNEFRNMHITGTFPEEFMCHSKCDLNLVAYFIREP